MVADDRAAIIWSCPDYTVYLGLLVSAVSLQTDGVVLYLFGTVDNKPCSLYGLS